MGLVSDPLELNSDHVIFTKKSTSLPDVTKPKMLLCLCNDNTDCVMKPPPFISKSTEQLSKLGHCVTSQDGRCYTVKDINIPSPKPTTRNRRFLLRQNASVFVTDGINYTQSDPEGTIDFEKYIHVRYGCLSSPSKVTFSCNGHLVKHLVPKAIACCNSSNFCNADLLPGFLHHSSDFDAYKTALRNQRYIEQVLDSRRTFISADQNTGPNLLSGGELVYDAQTSRNVLKKEYPGSNLTHVFNYLLVVVFSSIAIILLLALMSIYLCYKRRLHKRKVEVCESLLWYTSHNPTGNNSYLPTSVTNSWMSDIKTHKKGGALECLIGTKPRDRCGPSGSSSQTMSSNLTPTAESFVEVQSLHNSKLPVYLIQRTIGKQVILQMFLGRGRFSDVWMGTWRGEPIVAKIFTSSDRLTQSIWRRTALAHRSMLLRHNTVQGLIAIDWIQYPQEEHQHVLTQSAAVQSICSGPVLRGMLVAEQHQWGTLKDLMLRYQWRSSSVRSSPTEHAGKEAVHTVFTLNPTNDSKANPIFTTTDDLLLNVMLKMAFSLAQGLCFLHSEFVGTRGKPALAHRDLKPSNILVRSDWTCCIGDIGLAVRAPPYPIPLPLAELHQLYTHYIEQIDRPTNNKSLAPLKTISSAAEVTNDRRSHTNETSPGVQNNEMSTSQDGRVPIVSQTKLTMEKVELLDWWPVGGMQIGTPRYLSPELLNNTAEPFSLEGHQKADVYALGLILWELVTWTLPRNADCGSDGTSHTPEPQSCACDSTKCSQTSALGHFQSCYEPAYQCEWKAWCSRKGGGHFRTQTPLCSSVYNAEPGSSASTQNVPVTEHSHKMSNENLALPSEEPDLWTMRHIVCELNERPRLPVQPTDDRPSAAHLTSSADQNISKWIKREQLLLLLQNSRHICQAPQTNPDRSTEKSIITESPSSSGASSLNGAQVMCNSTTFSETQHLFDLLDLNHMVLKQFSKLLPECWITNPESRLTALRIRKTLQRIRDQLDTCRMQIPLQISSTPRLKTHPNQRPGMKHQPSDTSTGVVAI